MNYTYTKNGMNYTDLINSEWRMIALNFKRSYSQNFGTDVYLYIDLNTPILLRFPGLFYTERGTSSVTTVGKNYIGVIKQIYLYKHY